MNVIDIILLVFLLFGLVRGLIKGFFVELASVVALVLGIYGAIHFSFFFEELLTKWVSWEETYIELTAFALTFVIIVVGIMLLGNLLTKLSHAMALGLVNRLLGGVFGFLKTALLLSIVLLFFDILNGGQRFVEQEKLDNSMLYEPVKNLVPMILPSVLEEARELGISLRGNNRIHLSGNRHRIVLSF